jgi:cytochrome c-type biogenesis protein CcmH/NrfG
MIVISGGVWVLIVVIGVALLYLAFEKFSANSRVEDIIADWTRNDGVDERVRRRTIALMNNDMERIERLLENARQRTPGKSEQWYWEKILYDLERDHRG